MVVNVAILMIVLVTVIYLSMIGHEIGHLTAARLAKIQVEKIIFGIGPEVGSFTFLDTKYQFRILPTKGCIVLGDDVEDFLQYPMSAKIFFYSGGVVVNFLIFLIAYMILNMLPCFVMADKPDVYNLQSVLGRPIDLCLIINVIVFVNINTALALIFIPYIHFDGGRIIFLLIDKFLPNYIKHYLYISMALTAFLVLIVIVALARGIFSGSW